VAAVDGSFHTKNSSFAVEIGSSGFVPVYSYSDGVLTLEDPSGEAGKAYSVKSSPTVYSLENGKYVSVGVASLGKGSQVRLYDISNDKRDDVDIVVVKQ
jgi:hypothetical protein